jgi:tight adherence protein B
MADLLPALTFLLTTGSVFFFSLVILSVFARALERYQERYVVRSINDLGDMFLFIDARALLVLNVCVMSLAATAGLLIFGVVMAFILGVLGFLAPMVAVRYYRRRRIRIFNHQLVDALQTMANAFKAGLTFPQAMENIAKENPPPLGQEFGLFVKEIKLGVPAEQALINMTKRVGSDDLDLVVASTNVARQLGGNMAEMFETISATIRERFRLEGRIDSLTSQGRLQGWIVSAMPIGLGLVFNAMRPDLMGPMLSHWFGYVLIGTILVMEAVGILLIRRIVDIDV